MLEAVLFDLDNTLILFDEKDYFKNYISKVAIWFKDLMPEDLFKVRLMTASQALLQNNGEMLNVDFYFNVFAKDFEDKKNLFWQRFKDFYATEYDQFESLVTVPKGVKTVMQRLLAKNLKLVIASNPMFPLNIQLKRLSWAGIADLPYTLITHIENMTYCKPRLEYYQQIGEMINVPPSKCLMVGNDPVNDIIVANLGMKTFLTLDCVRFDRSGLSLSRELRNGSNHEAFKPDFKGPICKLPRIINQLMAAE
ncbi:HAD family hydrolase [candidate division KSB1 bacterium]|nr:HAD family hydrolase [candidate division KSB1 bacterium]